MRTGKFPTCNLDFIDLKQAYDRPHLWDQLNNIRMPTHLINVMLRGYMYRTKHRNGICRITLFSNVSLVSNVIRQMYDGDEYVLIDGAKTTSTSTSTVPLRSAKLGCPLSPLLFSFFINDVDDESGSGFVGAATGTEGLRVTHMLYADDLTATDPDRY